MSSYINIIGTLFDHSIYHTAVTADLVADLNLGGKKLQEINADLYLKIEDSKDKKSKGFFSSFEILQQSIPNPEIGDWAIVINNNKQVICTCNNTGLWELTNNEYSELNLSEYIKITELATILATVLKTINNNSLIGQGNINILSGESDIPKHIFLTLNEYNNLDTYEKDALYFIIEEESPESEYENYQFGGTFPLRFASFKYQFGGTFPLRFASFKFGDPLPLILN